MATRVVIAVACLPFPKELARPLMVQFIGLLKNSPSWRVRLDVLLPLQSASICTKRVENKADQPIPPDSVLLPQPLPPRR